MDNHEQTANHVAAVHYAHKGAAKKELLYNNNGNNNDVVTTANNYNGRTTTTTTPVPSTSGGGNSHGGVSMGMIVMSSHRRILMLSFACAQLVALFAVYFFNGNVAGNDYYYRNEFVVAGEALTHLAPKDNNKKSATTTATATAAAVITAKSTTATSSTTKTTDLTSTAADTIAAATTTAASVRRKTTATKSAASAGAVGNTPATTATTTTAATTESTATTASVAAAGGAGGNSAFGSSSSCFSKNSPGWLKGPRLGNVVEEETTNSAEFVRGMITDFPTTVLVRPNTTREKLKQSLCHERSRLVADVFGGTGTADNIDDDPKAVRMWAVRLIYLAMHYHQHHWAEAEASARLSSSSSSSSSCWQEAGALGIGGMDYECPDAKFMIASIADTGLGANIRGGVVSAMITALEINRVLLLVNNAPAGDRYLRVPWRLASCPRMDFQCFFLPPSPCVLTAEEIAGAYEMPLPMQRTLFKRGVEPSDEEVKNHRVWHVFLPLVKASISEKAKKRLYGYAQRLLAHVPESDPRLPLMKRAAETILENDPPRPGYDYSAANIKISHALTMYTLRPTAAVYRTIYQNLREITPHDLDSENAVGLPIRGSDKCLKESECLTFVQYMQVVTNQWQAHQQNHNRTTTNNNNVRVIFTTESTSVVREQQDFVANYKNHQTLQQKAPAPSYAQYNFDFMTNSKDVLPDSGFIPDKDRRGNHPSKLRNITAEDAMISALTSLRAQLLAGRTTVANCCSNFHILLGDYLQEGCTASWSNDYSFFCLQENADPALRVCCGWHGACKEARKKAIEEQQRQAAAAATT